MTTVCNAWIQILVGLLEFSLHNPIQNSSGAHTASRQMGTCNFFPGEKMAG
jgi:hypothetical protein